MKILITTDVYNTIVNGVAVSVSNLYASLKAAGNDVRILTLSPNRHSYTDGDIYYIQSVPIKIYPDARATVSFNNSLLKEIIEWQPEIIHSQCEFFTFVFARKLARHLNIPIVHTYHTLYEHYTHYFCPSKSLGRKIVAIGSRYICSHAHTIIAPTPKTKHILEDYGITAPIDIVPTGLNLNRFKTPLNTWERSHLKAQLNIPENAMVLVSLGRLAREKNIDFLIKEMNTDRIRQQNIHLVIAGDGPDKYRLKNLVYDLSLENTVHFTGLIPPEEVYRYYKVGDIFVSASNSETQGLTYIEAMACGLPILCLKDECLTSILKPQYNGWFFENAEDFSDRICEIYSMPENITAMKIHAQQTAEQFSCEAFGRRALMLYQKNISKEQNTCILYECTPERI